jgi:hypothetical protein
MIEQKLECMIEQKLDCMIEQKLEIGIFRDILNYPVFFKATGTFQGRVAKKIIVLYGKKPWVLEKVGNCFYFLVKYLKTIGFQPSTRVLALYSFLPFWADRVPSPRRAFWS